MKSKSDLVNLEISAKNNQKTGFNRLLFQVGDTIKFEMRRNLKFFIIVFVIYLAVFILTLVVQEVVISIFGPYDNPLVEPIIMYIEIFLDFLGFLIILSAVGFAGSIIAEDFQKQTDNLLFPKISKMRLLLGRIIARFGLISICIILYYLLTALFTIIRFQRLPIEFWQSLGWALMYAFMMFSFVTFLSSFMRSTALSIVLSLVFYLLVFNIIISVFMITSLKIEPLFIPTYYEYIIINCLNMPSPRYYIQNETDSMELFVWSTPDQFGAFFGMLLFIILFQGLAIVLYRRRQSKNQ